MGAVDQVWGRLPFRAPLTTHCFEFRERGNPFFPELFPHWNERISVHNWATFRPFPPFFEAPEGVVGDRGRFLVPDARQMQGCLKAYARQLKGWRRWNFDALTGYLRLLLKGLVNPFLRLHMFTKARILCPSGHRVADRNLPAAPCGRGRISLRLPTTAPAHVEGFFESNFVLTEIIAVPIFMFLVMVAMASNTTTQTIRTDHQDFFKQPLGKSYTDVPVVPKVPSTPSRDQEHSGRDGAVIYLALRFTCLSGCFFIGLTNSLAVSSIFSFADPAHPLATIIRQSGSLFRR